MSFINERYAIIRRSDKNMFYMYLGNDGLYYNYYDADGCIVHKGKLISDMDLDFTKYSFSLDKDDNIYCIYCDNSLQILECKNNSFIFTIKRSNETLFFSYYLSLPLSIIMYFLYSHI